MAQSFALIFVKELLQILYSLLITVLICLSLILLYTLLKGDNRPSPKTHEGLREEEERDREHREHRNELIFSFFVSLVSLLAAIFGLFGVVYQNKAIITSVLTIEVTGVVFECFYGTGIKYIVFSVLLSAFTSLYVLMIVQNT